MIINKKRDFLDVLRFLNNKNVNQNPELRDNFFKSIMVCEEHVPEYLEDFSNQYAKSVEKEFEERTVSLAVLYGDQIRRNLTDNLIEDRGDCLYIDGRKAPSIIAYFGSVVGMKKLVEQQDNLFGILKTDLLSGLIKRYCNDFVSGKNAERLNKLLVIYAEQIKNLEPTADIPIIIDEEFANELKGKKKCGILSSEDCLEAANNLIERKYPSKNPWEISRYEEEAKRAAK